MTCHSLLDSCFLDWVYEKESGSIGESGFSKYVCKNPPLRFHFFYLVFNLNQYFSAYFDLELIGWLWSYSLICSFAICSISFFASIHTKLTVLQVWASQFCQGLAPFFFSKTQIQGVKYLLTNSFGSIMMHHLLLRKNIST